MAPSRLEDLEEMRFAPVLKKAANDSAARTFDLSRPRLHMAAAPVNDFTEEADLDFDLEFEARMQENNGNRYTHFELPSGVPDLHLKEARQSGTFGGSASLKPAAWVKRRTQKQIREDMPPTPRGCEWRRSEEGWNLWRYWSEPLEDGQGKIKMTRYTGHLSHDAWQIMKEYDHEAFLSIVGQRLRRHGRG